MMSKAAALVSALLNVALGLLLYSVASGSKSGVDGLETGSTAPPFSGIMLNGDRLNLKFPAADPVVLYFFSPDCAWCERNFESVSALARRNGNQFRFVAVSLDEDGLTEWAALKNPRFDLCRRPDYRTAIAYPIRSTPTTVVVSREGRVEHVWPGAYTGENLKSIEKRFGLVLPEAAR